MNRICGKQTALILCRNNTYTTLPYSAETLRQVLTGYYTKETIANTKSTWITTGKTIAGCFTTRLDTECAGELFEALGASTSSATQNDGSPLTLLHDCVTKQTIYHNLTIPEFELRGENDSPIYLRCTVHPTKASYTEDFTAQTPAPHYDQNTRSRTWNFNGHNVQIDGKPASLIYRFCLTREIKEDFTKTTLTINYPVTTTETPTLKPVQTLCINLNMKAGATLTITDLVPDNDQTGVESSSEILTGTRYRVNGTITYEQRPFGGEHKVVQL